MSEIADKVKQLEQDVQALKKIVFKEKSEDLLSDEQDNVLLSDDAEESADADQKELDEAPKKNKKK